LLSATATALEVEPVIRIALFSVMKRCSACTASFGFAAESATPYLSSLPSTPVLVLGEIFLISSWPLLMCSIASW
jgi:hypothetical protein